MRAVLGKWWEGGWSSGRDRCGVCGIWRAGECGGDHHDRCFVDTDVRQNIATGVFNTNVRLHISAGELLMLQGGWGCSVGGGAVLVVVLVHFGQCGGGGGVDPALCAQLGRGSSLSLSTPSCAHPCLKILQNGSAG